jgi:hypothetical protein
VPHAPAAPRLIPKSENKGKKGIDITAYFHIRSKCPCREQGWLYRSVRDRGGIGKFFRWTEGFHPF